ncbi:uncharacterized protein LOC131585499 [Poecile atricapillus]|uniref:uncharacterized protein LOC131585499 n=1 Tax=Poecile atricapillus TaxID=48891 RepID=UPI002739C11A|nr:uncharacterized protein LOC131585499 [Poecile atricapillus]
MPSGGRSPSPPPHGPCRAEARGQPVGTDRSPVPGEDTPAPAPASGELAAAVPRRGCSGWKGRGGSRGVLAMTPQGRCLQSPAAPEPPRPRGAAGCALPPCSPLVPRRGGCRPVPACLQPAEPRLQPALPRAPQQPSRSPESTLFFRSLFISLPALFLSLFSLPLPRVCLFPCLSLSLSLPSAFQSRTSPSPSLSTAPSPVLFLSGRLPFRASPCSCPRPGRSPSQLSLQHHPHLLQLPPPPTELNPARKRERWSWAPEVLTTIAGRAEGWEEAFCCSSSQNTIPSHDVGEGGKMSHPWQGKGREEGYWTAAVSPETAKFCTGEKSKKNAFYIILGPRLTGQHLSTDSATPQEILPLPEGSEQNESAFHVSVSRERELEESTAVLVSFTCTNMEGDDSNRVFKGSLLEITFLPNNFHGSTFPGKAGEITKASANGACRHWICSDEQLRDTSGRTEGEAAQNGSSFHSHLPHSPVTTTENKNSPIFPQLINLK